MDTKDLVSKRPAISRLQDTNRQAVVDGIARSQLNPVEFVQM
jgi:hypothetical protein